MVRMSVTKEGVSYKHNFLSLNTIWCPLKWEANSMHLLWLGVSTLGWKVIVFRVSIHNALNGCREPLPPPLSRCYYAAKHRNLEWAPAPKASYCHLVATSWNCSSNCILLLPWASPKKHELYQLYAMSMGTLVWACVRWPSLRCQDIDEIKRMAHFKDLDPSLACQFSFWWTGPDFLTHTESIGFTKAIVAWGERNGPWPTVPLACRPSWSPTSGRNSVTKHGNIFVARSALVKSNHPTKPFTRSLIHF